MAILLARASGGTARSARSLSYCSVPAPWGGSSGSDASAPVGLVHHPMPCPLSGSSASDAWAALAGRRHPMRRCPPGLVTITDASMPVGARALGGLVIIRLAGALYNDRMSRAGINR